MMSMKGLCLILMFVVIVLLFSSGCTKNPSGSGMSPVQPEIEEIREFPDYPSPPEDNAVFAQINDKDQIDRTITVFFSGGKGQKMVKSAWILFKPDSGDIMRIPLDIRKQSEAVLSGTSGEDQVRVYAEYYDGKTYLIGERDVRMRQRL